MPLGVRAGSDPTWKRAALRWTIVPEAHVRLDDRALQVEMYDVFHLHWLCRLGHRVGAVLTLVGSMTLLNAVFAGLFPVGTTFSVGGAMALAFVELAYAAFLGVPVALAASVPLALMVVAANAITSMVSSPELVGASVALAGPTLQTVSHLAEPVPPPWSGSTGWKPVGRTWSEGGWRTKLGMLGLGIAAYPLEAWASLRIFPIQVLFTLLAAGYRPELARELLRRRKEILADHRNGWGRPGLDRVSL